MGAESPLTPEGGEGGWGGGRWWGVNSPAVPPIVRDGAIEAGARRVFTWLAVCLRALPLCHRYGGAVGAQWWLSGCAVVALWRRI